MVVGTSVVCVVSGLVGVNVNVSPRLVSIVDTMTEGRVTESVPMTTTVWPAVVRVVTVTVPGPVCVEPVPVTAVVSPGRTVDVVVVV